MDVAYYIEQIRDELDGAKAYIKRAIKCKSEHPDWASAYSKMSEAELGHAKNLVDIFEDDFKQNASEDSIYDTIHDSILDMYTEQSAYIKMMFQTYNERQSR